MCINVRCGNIEYVPFIEHPKGPSYIPEFHPDSFVSLEVPDEGSIYYAEYILSLRQAEEQEEEEERKRQRAQKETAERHHPHIESGDIDLSREIDDVPPPLDISVAAPTTKPQDNRQRDLFLGSGGAQNSGLNNEAFQPPPGQRNIDLYISIAMDLVGFFVACLLFYCICIPSRSLKKQ